MEEWEQAGGAGRAVHSLYSRSHPSPTQFQQARQGSLCNQAIMLITDGAVEDYEPVFEKYNWPDRKVTLQVAVEG